MTGLLFWSEKVEALATAWAAVDGALQAFKACMVDRARNDREGIYTRYMSDAGGLLQHLESRGFTVARFEQPEGGRNDE